MDNNSFYSEVMENNPHYAEVIENNSRHLDHVHCDDVYLHPCNFNMYSAIQKIQSSNDVEHGYATLSIDTGSNRSARTTTPANRTSKRLCCVFNGKAKRIIAVLALVFLSFIIGCLCTGFSVYLTKNSFQNVTYESERHGSTTKSYIWTMEKTNYDETITTGGTIRSLNQSRFLPVTTAVLTTYYPGATGLDGRVFKIANVADGQVWYYDASHNKVTVSLQFDNDSVKFMFKLQSDDSYKINSVGGNVDINDGYGISSLDTLNGRLYRNEDNARFLVTVEKDGLYRIQTKATGRYVRVDENLQVSSKKNIKDNRSLYKLVKVN